MGYLPPIGLVKIVKEGKDGKNFWTTIGAVWPTKNARVQRVVLDALPKDGIIYLTQYEPKTDGEEETAPDGIGE